MSKEPEWLKELPLDWETRYDKYLIAKIRERLSRLKKPVVRITFEFFKV